MFVGHVEYEIAIPFVEDWQWLTRPRRRLRQCLDKAFTKRGKFKSVFRIPRLISKF